jgi:hypothetical protein
MGEKFQEPSKWVATEGRWDFDEDAATYLGPLPENSSLPHGVALCDIRLRSGSIKAKVRFPEEIEKATASILFGYDPESREYYCAGIGAYGLAYDLTEYRPNRGWRGLAGAGSFKNIEAGRDYQIELRVSGTRIRLYVDEIKVVEHNLARPLQGDQIGLYAWGSGTIEYRSTVANPTSPRLFVVMQYGEPYDGLYTDVLKPIAEEKGLHAYRADDVYKPGIILQDIIRGIVESEIVIAEITPPNPNVFYELGYAHALDKTTILLAERGRELPFDVQGYRCIFYDNTIRGKGDVEKHLLKHLDNIIQEE